MYTPNRLLYRPSIGLAFGLPCLSSTSNDGSFKSNVYLALRAASKSPGNLCVSLPLVFLSLHCVLGNGILCFSSRFGKYPHVLPSSPADPVRGSLVNPVSHGLSFHALADPLKSKLDRVKSRFLNL